MKKILLLSFCAIVLSSCATYLPAPKSIIGMVDYSGLTNRGIFVTESNSVSFDYEPVGSIYVEEVGGWIRQDGKPNSVDPKADYYVGSNSKKVYQAPDIQAVYVKLAQKLKEVNANGLINLKITSTSQFDQLSKTTVGKIVITGMAINK